MIHVLILFFTLVLVTSKNQYKLTRDSVSDKEITGKLRFEGDFNINDYEIENINPKAELKLKENLDFSVKLEARDIIHVQIKPSEEDRWDAAPFMVSEDYNPADSQEGDSASLTEAGFTLTDEPFGFTVSSGEKKLFSLEEQFLFLDDLIVFRTEAKTDGIYGLGERTHKIKLSEGIYTIGNNDTFAVFEDEGKGGQSLYSSAPFYFYESEMEDFFGTLLVTTNIQDYILKQNKEQMSIETRVIGGVIDLYLFAGKKPMDVIRKLHNIVGKPTLPPYWALGWQQCRFGYRTDDELRTVWQTYKDLKLPLDVLWADIDYMEDYRDFTISEERYAKLPELVADVHANRQKFVPIVDIGVAKNDTDPAYIDGSNRGIWIQSNYTETDLVNIVWPGECVYPDWFHPETEKYWLDQLEQLNQKLDFDGIWLDMNEPASRLEDVGKGEIAPEYPEEKNAYANVAYVPGFGRSDLDTHVVSANGLNYGYPSKPYMTQYNTRPINGFLENKVTHKYLSKSGKRPFILSRSGMLGVGRMVGTWVADDFSNYKYMNYSVSQTITFGFLGFNIMGADICGINGDAEDKLCARWHALGSFYPFSRNHNSDKAKSQEPYVFGENSHTMVSLRANLRVRYSLMRYIASSMYEDNQRGGFFFRPVFMEFFNDPKAYENAEKVLMLGDSLLYIPTLTETEEDFESYVPKGDWTHIQTSTSISGPSALISADYTAVNVFVKAGTIIPFQESQIDMLTVEDAKDTYMGLIVNLSEGKASGKFHIFGDEILTGNEEEVATVSLEFSDNTLTIKTRGGSLYKRIDAILKRIKVITTASLTCTFACKTENQASYTIIELVKPLPLNEGKDYSLRFILKEDK